MKKILFVAAILACTLALKAQDKKPGDVIKVNTEKHDFGKIKQNVPVTTYFEITNISNGKIIIENAWGSCGCTTPEIPKEPIEANSSGRIKVQYNAAALNHFEKDVYIKIAGITEPKIVKITGEVLDPATYDAQVKGQKPQGITSAAAPSKAAPTTTRVQASPKPAAPKKTAKPMAKKS